MSDAISESFRDVLSTIMERSIREWVYLPSGEDWSLNSMSTTLESEEVPPELEDEPDAGMPHLAKLNNLVQAVPVATLQDIVSNAMEQKSEATEDELFCAFMYYYENDAFMELR